MDDLGNRVGSVTQRDGIHTYTVDALTNRYTQIDAVAITHGDAGNLVRNRQGLSMRFPLEGEQDRGGKQRGKWGCFLGFSCEGPVEGGRRAWAGDILAEGETRVWVARPIFADVDRVFRGIRDGGVCFGAGDGLSRAAGSGAGGSGGGSDGGICGAFGAVCGGGEG